MKYFLLWLADIILLDEDSRLNCKISYEESRDSLAIVLEVWMCLDKLKFILPWHIIRKRELRSWVQNLVLVSTVGSLLSSLSTKSSVDGVRKEKERLTTDGLIPKFTF